MRAAIVMCLVLAGCASQPAERWTWQKDGGTRNDFENDHGFCTAQAFGTANVSLLQAAIVQNSCLRGKGWRQVPG